MRMRKPLELLELLKIKEVEKVVEEF